MQVGDQIAELRVTPDRYLTVRYAGASGDFNPIHLDEEFARHVGLPGRILHGLWTMAQVARATTDAGGGADALPPPGRAVPRAGAAGAGACTAWPCSSAAWGCPSARSSYAGRSARSARTAPPSCTSWPSRTGGRSFATPRPRS